MSDEVITEVAEFNFPFKKHVTLKNVAYENGQNWLRVTIREQRRFTIFDLDPQSAVDFGKVLSDWANENQG